MIDIQLFMILISLDIHPELNCSLKINSVYRIWPNTNKISCGEHTVLSCKQHSIALSFNNYSPIFTNAGNTVVAVKKTASIHTDYSVKINTLIYPRDYRIVSIKTLFTPLPILLSQLFIHKLVKDYALWPNEGLDEVWMVLITITLPFEFIYSPISKQICWKNVTQIALCAHHFLKSFLDLHIEYSHVTKSGPLIGLSVKSNFAQKSKQNKIKNTGIL